jgi:hypothetical protein
VPERQTHNAGVLFAVDIWRAIPVAINYYYLLLLLLLLLTATEFSLDGSSPYTSTNETNKNKYT